MYTYSFLCRTQVPETLPHKSIFLIIKQPYPYLCTSNYSFFKSGLLNWTVMLSRQFVSSSSSLVRGLLLLEIPGWASTVYIHPRGAGQLLQLFTRSFSKDSLPPFLNSSNPPSLFNQTTKTRTIKSMHSIRNAILPRKQQFLITRVYYSLSSRIQSKSFLIEYIHICLYIIIKSLISERIWQCQGNKSNPITFQPLHTENKGQKFKNTFKFSSPAHSKPF